MTDRELVQQQYERVQERISGWPESLRQIPSYHELKVEQRQQDLKNISAKRDQK